MSQSPIMKQYSDIKNNYPDCLLFFRLGDFYELFYEDAVTASQALDITLTKRGRTEGQDIPMCGVPAHTSDIYLARLIQKGFKVAICEQLESPNASQKGPLKRDVVRVVTPGTLSDESLLQGKGHNFLVAISPEHDNVLGVATLDLSTGTFFVETSSSLEEVLVRLEPAELIIPDSFFNNTTFKQILAPWRVNMTALPAARFDLKNNKQRLEKHFQSKTLDVFGSFKNEEIIAAGVVLDYVQVCHKGILQLVTPPRQLSEAQFLKIDAASRQSLELSRSLRGDVKESLLHTLDETLTSSGSRLLSLWMTHPLAQAKTINYRLDKVDLLFQNNEHRESIRILLKGTPDWERALNRISLNRATPKDLGYIRDVLAKCPCILTHLKAVTSNHPLGHALAKEIDHLSVDQDLLNDLMRGLVETPINMDDFVAIGYDKELDHYRTLCVDGKSLIEDLQERYAKDTQIPSLKIKHNNIIGYYIDITPTHKNKVPEHFIHKQTLASSLRYTTQELNDLALQLEQASFHLKQHHQRVFDDFIGRIHECLPQLLETAKALATIDVCQSLAHIARLRSYVRPVVDDSVTFSIENGRHPIVEKALKDNDGPAFMANDCALGQDQRMILLTGPNMAGKSTYLRQNALLIVMAQMGSFVPCTAAHIGTVDKLFSRVGADDHLAAGRSTFMVEMIETSAILHQATSKSFVIVDEIGRGTSTYDGVSIAWSVLEYLALNNQCRGIFATHYHELVDATHHLPTVSCFTMQIQEWAEKIVFLYKLIPGTAGKSYGIHVAELAGFPKKVLNRAKEILHRLESEKQ